MPTLYYFSIFNEMEDSIGGYIDMKDEDLSWMLEPHEVIRALKCYPGYYVTNCATF